MKNLMILHPRTSTCTPESCLCMGEGVRMVMSIRCIRHRSVGAFNTSEATGGECTACAVEDADHEHAILLDQKLPAMVEERVHSVMTTYRKSELRVRELEGALFGVVQPFLETVNVCADELPSLYEVLKKIAPLRRGKRT